MATYSEYKTPLRGVYIFAVPNFDGTFFRNEVSVEVLGSTDKTYKVRLLMPIWRHGAGDIIRVQKKNIRINSTREIDTSSLWYNRD